VTSISKSNGNNRPSCMNVLSPHLATIWYNTAIIQEWEDNSLLQKILWVGIGGFTGAILRYLTNEAIQQWAANHRFPHGTLAVNLIGCAVFGLLSYLADTHNVFNTELRLLIFMGLLGAFTTFSTFSNETLSLIREARGDAAMANIGSHLVLGLVAVWGGRIVARVIWK
jgi:CrcB protein